MAAGDERLWFQEGDAWDVRGAYGQIRGRWRLLTPVFMALGVASLVVGIPHFRPIYLLNGVAFLLFSAGWWVMRTPAVEINDRGVRVRHQFTRRQKFVPWADVVGLEENETWWGDRLTLLTISGNRLSLQGLPSSRTFRRSLALFIEDRSASAPG